jgi:8-oxo-dGTP pyrophosphatase MutT (NUDIX family)
LTWNRGLKKGEKKMMFWANEVKAFETHNAFKSLCFRGNHMRTWKPKIYGGILSVSREDGQIEYAVVQGSYTGKWSFPKGHSMEGETPLECSLREIGEETGIDELPEPVTYMKVGYGHYYVFHLKDKLPLIARDTHEVINTKWATVDELSTLEVNADVAHYVKRSV